MSYKADIYRYTRDKNRLYSHLTVEEMKKDMRLLTACRKILSIQRGNNIIKIDKIDKTYRIIEKEIFRRFKNGTKSNLFN
jgi:hypothetical protein